MKAISMGDGASCTESGLTDARARLLSTMVERVRAEVFPDPTRGPVSVQMTGVWLDVVDDEDTCVGTTLACPVDRSPLCVCGHRATSHRLNFIDGDACESWCGCHRFRYPPSVEARGWSRCLDLCNCGGKHREGRVYFVSVRYRGDARLVLGPFVTHGEALSMVVIGRARCEERDPWAGEYFFGTCSLPGDTKEIGAWDDRAAFPAVVTPATQTGWEWAS